MAVDARERWRCVAGTAFGMLLTALLCHRLAPRLGLPANAAWLAAPMGASAVLVFCVPASPMAQPWAVVAGNTLCALVGVACVHLLGTSEWAAGIAVAVAIGAMFALRCLHPPGGASALLMVLGRCTRLSLCAVPRDGECGAAGRRRHRLQTLLSPSRTVHTDKAEAVGQIMATNVQVARADQPIAELVPLFATTGHHHIPVVDGERRLVGILTPSDLVAALCRQGAGAEAAAAAS